MDQKGVLSADFIFATLLLLVVITAGLSVVSTGMDTAQSAEFSKAKVLADSLSRNINAVYTDGDGSYILFNLTSDFNYTVYISNSGVNVEYQGKNASSSIIPYNDLNSPSTTMHPGEVYNITNNGGTITFNKIT